MVSWRVGKTMVGYGKPSVDVVATTERQAKYKMGQVMRQTAISYRLVTAPEDPHQWGWRIWDLEQWAEKLENGEDWPPTDFGTNWIWSLPWGRDKFADRDIWVFWVKAEGGNEGTGDGAVVLDLSPRGGATRELATSGQAA